MEKFFRIAIKFQVPNMSDRDIDFLEEEVLLFAHLFDIDKCSTYSRFKKVKSRIQCHLPSPMQPPPTVPGGNYCNNYGWCDLMGNCILYVYLTQLQFFSLWLIPQVYPHLNMIRRAFWTNSHNHNLRCSLDDMFLQQSFAEVRKS